MLLAPLPPLPEVATPPVPADDDVKCCEEAVAASDAVALDAAEEITNVDVEDEDVEECKDDEECFGACPPGVREPPVPAGEPDWNEKKPEKTHYCCHFKRKK